ncbi:MAG: hypothetical protein LAO51_09450 [Acidobacteriia bacterium]|nr:hypothetical protein [Terriglobia bacterium]
MSDQPDFSGIWRADFERSRLEIEVPSSTVIRIEHEEPAFVLTRTHAAGDVRDVFSVRLVTDGRETVSRKDSAEILTRCAWEGASLSFHSRILSGGTEATNVVVYKLSPDGGELVADETYQGPPKSYHNTWVLVRDERG